MALRHLAPLAALLLPLTTIAAPLPPGAACNLHSELCDRPYDEVSYVTTHNAFNAFVSDATYHFVNQGYDIPTQLADGVRALMIDVHEYNGHDSSHDGEIWVCHSFCDLGGQPLVEVLDEIRAFLAANPHEVVTIIFESYVSQDVMEDAFVESGLLEYTHQHSTGQEWPTLREMIEDDGRLVVLTDRDGDRTGWYLDVWAFAVETHYSVQHAEDFTCDYNRGGASNSLFIFNHFLTYPLARRSLARQVNPNPFLIDRALSCWEETRKQPHFVTVDFWTIGDVKEAVDILNDVL